ncbi:hypothetical protein [Nocardia sp. NPDC004711]
MTTNCILGRIGWAAQALVAASAVVEGFITGVELFADGGMAQV